ncbi:hypothetical protein LWI28_000588 [Acer negundo]|uniref:Uncharacterized protein n=1 Tax=Acer negundo TaxID=4023 RepID=A0AAD5INJ4_ACENE|nr:hypothetical protein LWI28_000588 [Acer negundo]
MLHLLHHGGDVNCNGDWEFIMALVNDQSSDIRQSKQRQSRHMYVKKKKKKNWAICGDRATHRWSRSGDAPFVASPFRSIGVDQWSVCVKDPQMWVERLRHRVLPSGDE